MPITKTILVLGGTGHFGGRICRRLLGQPNTRLIVTSRSLPAAKSLAAALQSAAPDFEVRAAALDHYSAAFETDLQNLDPDILIHTAGPFQGQDYRVAEACIDIGCHYIDLADGREFVHRFAGLDERARSAGVLLVSGASTLPGLSSAVIGAFQGEFRSIDTVEISIAPAHQTPRGRSTISAVLSYCGAPVRVLENGNWVTRYGWQNLKTQFYPSLGSRFAAVCDVPDLAVLPDVWSDLQTVTFHAALEAWWEQLALYLMGGLVRMKIVRSWDGLVPLFHYCSEKFIAFGSQRGGMHVRMAGTGMAGARKELTWFVTAENNDGPEIPCTPAIILARKLAGDELDETGAMPCLKLFSLEDFDKEVRELDISWDLVS